jgi:hypothetical protein
MKARAGVARSLQEEGPGSPQSPIPEKVSLSSQAGTTKVGYLSSAFHEFKISFETNKLVSSFPLICSKRSKVVPVVSWDYHHIS